MLSEHLGCFFLQVLSPQKLLLESVTSDLYISILNGMGTQSPNRSYCILEAELGYYYKHTRHLEHC